VNLGAALIQKGEPAQAEAVLREAVRREPRDGGARTNLGRALLAQDRASEAAVELEAAVAANPGLPEAHEGLALVYRKLGRSDLADQHARAARSLREAR
jgi:Tfp pilus assembly protein PilF